MTQNTGTKGAKGPVKPVFEQENATPAPAACAQQASFLPMQAPASGRVGGIKAAQIALPFAYRPRFGRSDFVAAPSNAAARAWVLDTEAQWRWPEGRMVLWGDEGTGKTHMLSVWAARHGAPVVEGSLLNAQDVANLFEEGGFRALALDNADRVQNERDLLHLINLVRERRMVLLMAARTAPTRWPIALPDLASRVRATSSVPLGQAEESLLRRLFLRLLAERQIVVAQPVTEWLLRRLPRNASAIRTMAARLDQAALAAGGKVTRALAQSVMEDMQTEKGER